MGVFNIGVLDHAIWLASLLDFDILRVSTHVSRAVIQEVLAVVNWNKDKWLSAFIDRANDKTVRRRASIFNQTLNTTNDGSLVSDNSSFVAAEFDFDRAFLTWDIVELESDFLMSIEFTVQNTLNTFSTSWVASTHSVVSVKDDLTKSRGLDEHLILTAAEIPLLDFQEGFFCRPILRHIILDLLDSLCFLLSLLLKQLLIVGILESSLLRGNNNHVLLFVFC